MPRLRIASNREPHGADIGLIRAKLVHETPIRLVFLTSDKRVIIHYGGQDNPGDRRNFIPAE